MMRKRFASGALEGVELQDTRRARDVDDNEPVGMWLRWHLGIVIGLCVVETVAQLRIFGVL